MNILFLDQFSALGGAQQCLLDLVPAILERGWGARAAIPPGGPLAGLLHARGLRVDEIRSGPYRSGRKSVADILRFAADLPAQGAAIADLLDKAAADLIYVNGPRMLIPAAFAAHGRVPILFHAHHCIGQRSAAYVEGLALRQSHSTVAACCDAVARPLRKWVPDGRIEVIPNGTADLGFREAGLAGKRIGIIGRIAPEKGQVEFLRAAALLVSRAPDARFVICGAPLFGDRGYYKEVLRLAAYLPVEFLDWQEDAAAIMRGLDVLVIPSQQEGMPRVLLEAFSAGVPVVAFAVGGIPEAIEDGITGFLARGTSPGELAERVRQVLECDSHRLHAIAQNARREWERRYTLAAYRARITSLMEECVQGAAPETIAPPPVRSEMRQPEPKDSRSV